MAKPDETTETRRPVDHGLSVDQVSADAGQGLGTQLIDYLKRLGFEDDHLARITSLLQAAHEEELPGTPQDPETFSRESQPDEGLKATGKRTITLHIAEEQPILRQSYKDVFSAHPSIVVSTCADDTTAASLVAAASLKPDVILLGVKEVRAETVEMLEVLREASPKSGIVLLFAFYTAQGIEALREFARVSSSGCGYLLKHTIDTVEQLQQIVHWVADGKVIIDPAVMEGLLKTGDTSANALHGLSPKALEVLMWLAKGYKNEAIADTLSRDTKTIERHINNIYSTFDAYDSGGMHPRVHATLMYLKAVGAISTE